MTILLAGNNQKKISELKAILPDVHIQTMRDYGLNEELKEDGWSFRENAFQKARTVFLASNSPTLSDDSGLCIRALNNEPGILSARYAGTHRSDEDNIRKVLLAMKGQTDPFAFFITVLCYIDLSGQVHFFEGIIRGSIANQPRGANGFGYDPIFVPEGKSETFAEMPIAGKNAISHRYLALTLFATFLRNQR